MKGSNLAQVAHDRGRGILAELEVSDAQAELARQAQALGTNLKDAEEACAWLSTIYALQAIAHGNFGIGSVLIDADNNIVAAGHNEVFHPRFRSDAHAEMVVMNRFEERVHDARGLRRYRLFTSLESCPMCLARLISAGIGAVLHVSDDEGGGMARRLSDLPSTWRELAEGREFRRANCAPAIAELSGRIFGANVLELNEALMARLDPKA